jgi:3-oxoacyl-[acyl-carrier-protein] synthase-1
MRSSLGDDAVGVCAALRAGLVRPRELIHCTVINEDGSPEHPIGHPVETVQGFQGMARLLALAHPALEELISRAKLRDPGPPKRLGFFLALPAPRESAKPPRPEPGLCAPLLKRVRLTVHSKHQAEFRFGHASVALAINFAALQLAAGQIDRCIVGAVDSYLDGETLQTLHKERRLKSYDAPAGFQPGEAASFLLLEPVKAAHRRGAQVQGVISHVLVAGHERNQNPSAPGVVLGGAVASALNHELGERVWIISDLNGESGRAMEWGNLLVRLAATHPALRDAPVWYPATSLGNTGAASGAIGICAAVRAFARGYAPADAALLLSSSDGPERGVVKLERLAR